MLNGICIATHTVLSHQFLLQCCLLHRECWLGVDFSVPLSGSEGGKAAAGGEKGNPINTSNLSNSYECHCNTQPLMDGCTSSIHHCQSWCLSTHPT